jgi:hypothetical protein
MMFAMMPAPRALIWSVVAAYLILPVRTSFEIPVIPSLDKSTIANLSILLCCFIFVREKWLGLFRHAILAPLAALFVFSPFLTSWGNLEALELADRSIPAMTGYDALAQSAVNFMTLIPFVAGYGLLRSEQRHAQLLVILSTALLAYSILMIVEIRFSPQLHRMIYGFFPHSFGQQMRADGFRPVVFIGHGLLVAIICAMATGAMVARWRLARGDKKSKMAAGAGYLWILLIFCKSLGAAILTFVWAPILAFMRARHIVIITGLACIAILAYPGMRSMGLVPTQTVGEIANAYSDERGGSLGLRLKNEDELLDKTAQKPLTGWGSWGRNRIYRD